MARKPKIRYSKKLCCFDIETTHENINGIDCLYTWHWQAVCDNEYYTFNSWAECLDAFVAWNDADRIIVFVHFLSYEIESIIRNLKGHSIDGVFATDTHAPLKFILDDCVEFRCSLRLTNKSLAQCAKDVGLQKLEMDYSKIRHPCSTDTPSDYLYCAWDVLIMVAKIRQLEQAEQMPFWEFPLTNTGFLRKEARKAMSKNKKNRKLFLDSRLNVQKLKICKDAFMGGYVHANYIHMGDIVTGIDSYDYGSAYPFAMLAHKYPMGALYRVDNPTFEDIKTMIHRDDVLFICRIVLKNVKSKMQNTFISYNKCSCYSSVVIDGIEHKCRKPVLDNGRIYSAEYLETAVTCLDLQIIMTAYSVDSIAVKELYWSRAGYLPKEYLNVMLHYYSQKQDLKGVKGEESNYMKAKNRVNSFYGMEVTFPIHPEIILDMDSAEKWEKKRISLDDVNTVSELLDDFYKSYNSFLPYQWGIFVPAWTRYHLWMDFIRYCDKNTIYCDTDSAKIVNRDVCLPYIDKYNNWVIETRQQRLKELGIDRDFKDLGIFDWETEKEKWKGFKTLGAKKYMVLKEDGKIETTVAGLSKSASEFITSFDDFTPGTTFDKDISGRTISRYIDNPDIPGCYGDGGGCWIEETTYTLSISDDYALHTNYPDKFPWSDIIISATGRKHTGDFRREERINKKLLLDKQNVYGMEIK